MENSRNNGNTSRQQVLLVSVAPIPRRSLELRLAAHADVLAVEYGTPSFTDLEASLEPSVVVIDLTSLRDLQVARSIGGSFTARGASIVHLGYAHDEGAERGISEEMNATFNPGIEGILELLQTPRRRPSPIVSLMQPGSPAGCCAASSGDLLGAKGDSSMDLMRKLHVKMVNRESGQTLAEYGLILALVAILCIAALGVLRGGIVNTLTTVAASL